MRKIKEQINRIMVRYNGTKYMLSATEYNNLKKKDFRMWKSLEILKVVVPT